MSTSDNQVSPTDQLKRLDRVRYRKNAWTMISKPAILQWIGNRIRLYEIDPATGRPGKVIFDHDVSEIDGIETANQLMALTVGNREYQVNFGRMAGAFAAIAVLLPIRRVVSEMGPMQNARWWQANLQAHGVRFKLTGASKKVIIGFVIYTIIVFIAVVLPKLL